eukprot:6059600-Amphidinium_carterae.1
MPQAVDKLPEEPGEPATAVRKCLLLLNSREVASKRTIGPWTSQVPCPVAYHRSGQNARLHSHCRRGPSSCKGQRLLVEDRSAPPQARPPLVARHGARGSSSDRHMHANCRLLGILATFENHEKVLLEGA